jgi:outer membrane protein assembly factor BamD
MAKSITRIAPLLLAAILLTGCGLFGSEKARDRDPGVGKMYQDAKDDLEAGNYERAVKGYEALEARYPYGAYAQQAELEMAYAQYKQGEATNAIATADRFIKAHPNHVNVDYAFYVKGLANFKDDFGYFSSISGQDLAERDMKAARDAFDTFKDLITRFPLSRYAEDSGKRMVYLQNNMASHEVHVADYYLRRGAWLAAANRAQVVVKDFPRAPAAEQALYIMVRAYHELGLQELADDSLKVMQKNFPQSPLLSDAREPNRWWEFWHGLF